MSEKASIALSVVILVNTQDIKSYNITNQCINSLRKSLESCIRLEIILIESGELSIGKYDLQEQDILLKYDKEPFNFHRGLNLGLRKASGDYIAFCNNDLIFYKNWAECLIKKMIEQGAEVGSPVDPKDNKLWMYDLNDKDFIEGYEIQKFFKGWCFVVKRQAFNILNNFDEKFSFYYADNDFIMKTLMKGLKHIVVLGSYVTHLEKEAPEKIEEDITVLLKNANIEPRAIPNYVLEENRFWVLQNSKMIEGLLAYHNKWGSHKVIKFKKKIVHFMKKIGLRFILKYI